MEYVKINLLLVYGTILAIENNKAQCMYIRPFFNLVKHKQAEVTGRNYCSHTRLKIK